MAELAETLAYAHVEPNVQELLRCSCNSCWSAAKGLRSREVFLPLCGAQLPSWGSAWPLGSRHWRPASPPPPLPPLGSGRAP